MIINSQTLNRKYLAILNKIPWLFCRASDSIKCLTQKKLFIKSASQYQDIGKERSNEFLGEDAEGHK